MKIWRSLFFSAAAVALGVLVAGCQSHTVKSEVKAPIGQTVTVGEPVRLFHSGSEDVRKTFCVGDVVPVYREVYIIGVAQRTEVGKVKVVSYEGNHAILGTVVDGSVKAGNIAQKDAAACMVYVPETN